MYVNGKTETMFSIPMGGYHFSLAIASQFNISLESAELLKEEKGKLLFESYEEKEESIELAVDSLYLSRKFFIQTLESKAEELLGQIKERLVHQKLMDKISLGFLFTGGTSKLPGFTQLASFHLGGQVSHPNNLYDNFKQTNNFSLIQQAYLEDKLKIQKSKFSSKWFLWRDLF